MLTATRTILDLDARIDDTARFIQRHDPQDPGRAHWLGLDAAIWQDLGQPHTITVTIEPGDQLNTIGSGITTIHDEET